MRGGDHSSDDEQLEEGDNSHHSSHMTKQKIQSYRCNIPIAKEGFVESANKAVVAATVAMCFVALCSLHSMHCTLCICILSLCRMRILAVQLSALLSVQLSALLSVQLSVQLSVCLVLLAVYLKVLWS